MMSADNPLAELITQTEQLKLAIDQLGNEMAQKREQSRRDVKQKRKQLRRRGR